MAENKLYIMTGVPYSGKTTLTKELTKKIKVKVVSADEILGKKDIWGKRHPTQNEWEMAYLEAVEEIKNYLIQGKSVIFDESNLEYRQRENLRKIAKNLEVEAVLIYLIITKDEAIKRWQSNLKTKIKKQLSWEFFEKTFELFEEPQDDEKPIVYNQGVDLKTWIEKNIATIKCG